MEHESVFHLSKADLHDIGHKNWHRYGRIAINSVQWPQKLVQVSCINFNEKADVLDCNTFNDCHETSEFLRIDKYFPFIK